MIALGTALVSALLALPLRENAPAESSVTAPTVATRRVALFVGANDGGPGRVKLRYAGSDARALARVLADVGGVERRDTFVLIDPGPTQLLEGFQRVQRRVQQARAAGERVQFLFYYSGHADDRGVLLGAARVDYPRLRALIHGVGAQVRLGLLDSCSSGAFVRQKGGHMRPPLATGDPEIEGHAFLTSSSAEEAAQESDRIGGSYFTHYLVSGLRGAADVDRDRRVTLNEAYRFAFDETLAGTETTLGRAQHPVYDIQLVGTGDLVMTDLRETSAVLDIHATVGGRVYVRDEQGRLVAELYKGVGAGAVSLALEPGRYSVVIDDGAQLWRGNVDVRPGMHNELTRSALQPLGAEATVLRGDTPVDPEQYRIMPIGFGLVPPLTTNHIERKRKVINRFGLNLILGRAAQIDGVELSSGGNWTDERMRGVQLSAAANYVGGDVHGFQSTGGVNVVGGDLHGVQGAAGVNVVSGDAHGLQAAGGVNALRGHMRGVQAAAGVNWARSVDGAQIGPINATRDAHGAQVGVINVSTGKVAGVQIGVLNYADEADAQVGVISVSRKGGGVFADVWTSDLAAFNLAVKFRAKYTYSFLAIGIHPAGAGRGYMGGVGFGGHIPLPRKFYLDIDLGSYAVQPKFNFRDDPGLLGTLRVLLGWQIGRRLAVYGGPTFNGYVDLEGDRERIGYGYVMHREPIESLSMRVWPGFALGLQL